MRAFAGDVDGQVGGLFGLYYEDKEPVIFTAVTPEFRSDKALMQAGLRRVLRWLKGLSVPAVAVASDCEPGAALLLRKVGFRHLGTVQGREVFRWVPN